jgi:hypothetical protein
VKIASSNGRAVLVLGDQIADIAAHPAGGSVPTP